MSRAIDVLLGATLMYATLIMAGLDIRSMMGRDKQPGVVPVVGRRDDASSSTLAPAKRGVLPDVFGGKGAAVAAADATAELARVASSAASTAFSSTEPQRVSEAMPGDSAHEWNYQVASTPSECPLHLSTLSIDDVAFGILTSERFLDTRLASQRRTWLRDVRHVVFYSESVIAHLPTVALAPPEGEELVGGGAWKNFPALIDLHRRYPTKKWIFFCDDDTFIFLPNLLRSLSKYSPDRDYYVGLYWTPRIDMEWKEVQIAYASGGAGYAISRSLLARLAPTMPRCHANYTRWAGDIRVGKCIADLNVRITPAVGFHHEGHDKYVWDSSGGGFPYGHLSNRASAAVTSPVTFHHLSVDQIAMYYRMRAAESRGPHGQLYRYDFSRYYLKEYMAYSPAAQHRFRILLGVSVEVAEGAPTAADATGATGRGARPGQINKNWRKDFSDPLYLRALPEESPTDQARFEMVIAKVPAESAFECL